MSEPTDHPPSSVASLPEAIEERAYEVLLELPAGERAAAFAALLAEQPEHRSALLRLQRSLRGAESALQGTGLAAAPPPERIGPYRLLRQIGEGGFGVVWLAEQQEPLQRLVALKLIRPGMDTKAVLRRFEAERGMLSRFDHPCIARVLDAGQTPGGDPFLVTEYVDGAPLVTFCDRQGLSLRARLELYVRVCDGVQHAHQRGVIHRDLKPSNVLVAIADGAPVPKIIDFGIARALSGDSGRQQRSPEATRAGTLLGTPEYMSPEQASGDHDVDIRTDVYALGVLLFELLVGDLPQGRERWRRAGFADLVDLIRHAAVPRPSVVAKDRVRAKELRADLDWIVLRAAAKERDQRYGTVAELATDVRAFLADRPVQAGPPRFGLLLRKFVRRHRVSVAAAALTIASLLVGLGMTLWSWRQSRSSEQQARLSATAAQQHLDNYLRLAQVVQLQRLRAAAGQWPAPEQRAAVCERWLVEARALLEQRPLVEATLAQLPEVEAPGDGALAAATFLRAALQQYLRDLDRFVGDDGELRDVERRLAWAKVVRSRTIDDMRARWDAAIAAIAASRHYGGLRLEPQLGLVPLGEDPDSGLWEFVHLQSGGEPGRDARGRIVPSPGMGIVLVLLPGGVATIGAQGKDPSAPHYDRDSSSRAALQQVRLRPFFLSKYEMTRAQWERAIGKGAWFFADGLECGQGPITGLQPAENLSWQEVADAMQRLDLLLPTDAQWEYACRAGTGSIWSCGDRPEQLSAFANLAGRELRQVEPDRGRLSPEHFDPYALPAPVGSFRPNGFGLHDMHGNIGEACADSVIDHDSGVRDGDGFRNEGDPERALSARGGSFSDRVEQARSAGWATVSRQGRNVQLGVRPARAVE